MHEGMITFIICIAALIAGYFTYGKFTEKFFGTSSEIPTPAKRMADGVDYKEMKPWRIFIIQFLNIAGLGPIFGAILGAAYGPVAYVWIVIGCIFMGAAHDFFSGMLSVRNDGMSIPDMVGKYLGKGVRRFLVIFSSFILIAVGVSFVTGPADLLATLTSWDKRIWLYIVFLYYIVATLLPIDKIIGRIYPVLGAILLFMAVAIAVALIGKGLSGEIRLTELTPGSFRNFHTDPEHNILIPMLFVVISCGAISGFHSTQSPIMARCITDEKYGRPIFYGAMIAEGIVAMVWATAAMAYFGGPDGLNAAADAGKTPAIIVDEICKTWLGKAGAVIAVLGVVACPITSGDTAFRSLRITIADALKFNQKPIYNTADCCPHIHRSFHSVQGGLFYYLEICRHRQPGARDNSDMDGSSIPCKKRPEPSYDVASCNVPDICVRMLFHDCPAQCRRAVPACRNKLHYRHNGRCRTVCINAVQGRQNQKHLTTAIKSTH